MAMVSSLTALNRERRESIAEMGSAKEVIDNAMQSIGQTQEIAKGSSDAQKTSRNGYRHTLRPLSIMQQKSQELINAHLLNLAWKRLPIRDPPLLTDLQPLFKTTKAILT
jgi:hypothetical protein